MLRHGAKKIFVWHHGDIYKTHLRSLCFKLMTDAWQQQHFLSYFDTIVVVHLRLANCRACLCLSVLLWTKMPLYSASVLLSYKCFANFALYLFFFLLVCFNLQFLEWGDRLLTKAAIVCHLKQNVFNLFSTATMHFQIIIVFEDLLNKPVFISLVEHWLFYYCLKSFWFAEMA